MVYMYVEELVKKHHEDFTDEEIKLLEYESYSVRGYDECSRLMNNV